MPWYHPHLKYAQKLHELGITTGCGFRERLGLTSTDGFYYLPAPYFADVPTTHPYFGFIQKMKELGIAAGCGTTAYCPDAPGTRGQAAVMVVRALLNP